MRISKKIATAAAALALAAGMLAPTACDGSGADFRAFAPFRANRDTIPTCVIFIACFFVRF